MNHLSLAVYTDLLLEYIDRRIEEEFASREEDSEGYTDAPIAERKATEEAKKRIYKAVEDALLRG